MRCPDCQKFVAYGDPEFEVDDAEAQDGQLVASIRMVLPCEDCGTELKETTFDVDERFEHECPKQECVCGGPRIDHYAEDGETLLDGIDHDFEAAGQDPDYDVDEPGVEDATRQESTKKVARWVAIAPRVKQLVEEEKAIPYRFRRTFYGGLATFNITCQACGEVTSTEWTDLVQASGMDELV